MLPIIDTHQHLWDLNRFELPWVTGAGPLNRSFMPEDYAAAIDGLNVVGAVYMEVDVVPAQRGDEAAFIVEHCARSGNPTLAAVISGDPASPHFGDYLHRYAASPYVRGVRRVLHVPETPPGFCLQPDFVSGVQQLGEEGLSFDLCMRPGELFDAVELAQACPETLFILDHCGNAHPQVVNGTLNPTGDEDNPMLHSLAAWEDALSELAECENVVCKISGIVARANPEGWTAADLAPTVNTCLDIFGPDAVVFGGDWPVCTLTATYREWVEALRRIIADRPESDQRKLLAENAVRLYGLNGD